jgi:hypothetical protein
MASALSVIAVINKHIAKLHHVGSLYILTYDARKIKHQMLYISVVKTYKLRETSFIIGESAGRNLGTRYPRNEAGARLCAAA